MNSNISNKVISCDLDGTLAPSKSKLEPYMAEIIGKVLEKHRMAVISGKRPIGGEIHLVVSHRGAHSNRGPVLSHMS